MLPEIERVDWLVLMEPGVPVAEKFTLRAVPCTVAVTVVAPAVVPSVRVVEERPLALVAFEAEERVPALVLQSTVALGTTLLWVSLTMATQALERAEPTVPV